jgi:hypothetical protein
MQIAKLVVVGTKAWAPRAAMAFVVLVAGCRTSSPSRPPDSTHAALLRQYLRDSSVIDSLSRLVKTDSLRALYRLALQPARAGDLVELAWCEQLRLTVRHGIVPARKAIDRLLDTVYEDRGIRGRDDAFGYFASRATNSGAVDSRACGKMPPRSPEVVAGTRVNQNPFRPLMH